MGVAESRQVVADLFRAYPVRYKAVACRAGSAAHLHSGEHAARRAEQIRLVDVGAKAVAAGDATEQCQQVAHSRHAERKALPGAPILFIAECMVLCVLANLQVD